jgi:hypothetical protein
MRWYISQVKDRYPHYELHHQSLFFTTANYPNSEPVQPFSSFIVYELFTAGGEHIAAAKV